MKQIGDEMYTAKKIRAFRGSSFIKSKINHGWPDQLIQKRQGTYFSSFNQQWKINHERLINSELLMREQLQGSFSWLNGSS